ncbi:MAG: transposase [Gemmataceae bacterium]|nr:transposase [Gemmataceae bacterium]
MFDLSVGRSNDCPQAFLRGFKGFLQADGYSGCDARRLLAACSTMLGEAFTSALNQWPTWTVDVTGGRLKIDNHPAEQAIRPLAIERRNWLHVGGDGGLNPTAVLLSLAASAKRHAVNPWEYFKHVLTELPARPPNADVGDLLPDNWARAGPSTPSPG